MKAKTALPALTNQARQALAFARDLCREKHLRFTPIRQQALEAIWRINGPVKAYEMQAHLQNFYGLKVNPPTIYRTLEFLYSNGLIHRIESLNAFAPCHDNLDFHEGQFVICSNCGHVEEIHEDAIINQLSSSLKKRGYALNKQTVELRVDCLKRQCPQLKRQKSKAA